MNNFHKLERRREEKILNRILSIKHDAEFVEFCSKKFIQFPVVPNQRAGDWYVNPKLKTHGYSVYFKSTDGHFGEWSVSLKRLNLHILKVIAKFGGLVIVDVTKRGKRFPDALAKTIPIWISVMNKIAGYSDELKIPASIVSLSENSQINEKLDGFVEKVKNCGEDINVVKKLFSKPLRPIWIHPSSRFIQDVSLDSIWSDEELNEMPFYPIILLSASISTAQAASEEDTPLFCPSSTFEYVQGASDDSELWCPGLSSSNFWNICNLVDCDTQLNEIMGIIEGAINSRTLSPCAHFAFISSTSVALGNLFAAKPPDCWNNFDFIVNCGAEKYDYLSKFDAKVLFLPIESGKRGQKQLFDSISPFLKKIEPELKKGSKILIHCDTGKDRSAAITLALFLRYYNMHTNQISGKSPNPYSIITKNIVTKMLIKIQSSYPQALPSRALMKKLNLFFIRNDAD